MSTVEQVRDLVIEDFFDDIMRDLLILPKIHHLQGIVEKLLDLLDQVQLIINSIYVLLTFPIHFNDIEVKLMLEAANLNS